MAVCFFSSRRRHTRLQGDWSSDVCSSDLGSAMPAWKGRLSDAERRDVAAYIKTFSSFFADTSQHVAPLKFSNEPSGGAGATALKTGRQFYDSIRCRKGHGGQGRGGGAFRP